ncbi:MAG: DNA-binding protein [Chloroflexi bacterium HGW-Chloroflexi-2]|jgi:excisionase family DNA binding protein|nr:MAG: DNA-binding protein [Chloroflexi bacterium HGW-Chloroflexi-2]
MADTNEFWTAEEVSAYLRIPQSTVYKLAQDKVLPGFKVGKHWRFRRDTIINWIKEKEGNSSNEVKPNIFSG